MRRRGKIEKEIMILLSLLVLIGAWFWYSKKTAKAKGTNGGNGTQTPCSNHTCGGYGGSFLENGNYYCPEGCSCPPPDPHIPDAPRTCI